MSHEGKRVNASYRMTLTALLVSFTELKVDFYEVVSTLLKIHFPNLLLKSDKF